MKKVKVVIPAYNASSTIKDVLEALRDQDLKDLNIVVIDSGKPCKSLIENEHYYYLGDKNISKKRNIGVKMFGKSEYTWFLDSDCIPKKDCARNLLAASIKAPIVAGAMVDSPRLNKSRIGRVAYISYLWSQFSPIAKPKKVLFAPTANLLVQQNILNELKFDEDLLAGEDADFFFRANKKGLKAIFANNAVCIHNHGRITLKDYFNKKIFTGHGATEFRFKQGLKTSFGWTIPKNHISWIILFIPFIIMSSARIILKNLKYHRPFYIIRLFDLILLGQIGYYLGILKSLRMKKC